MAAQSNPPASFTGYTWGFADNTRTDTSQIVEISPNINYTVSDNVSVNVLIKVLLILCVYVFVVAIDLYSIAATTTHITNHIS